MNVVDNQPHCGTETCKSFCCGDSELVYQQVLRRDVMTVNTSQCTAVTLLVTSKTYVSVCGSCLTLEQTASKN